MTGFDWLVVAIGTMTPVALVGFVVYLVGAKHGYKEGWDDGLDDIRDSYAFRREQLDKLYQVCKAQRDEASAGLAVAHIERDRVIAELDEVRSDFNDSEERLAGVIRDYRAERDRLSADNARLIEENGRLIAELSGSVNRSSLNPVWNAADELYDAICSVRRDSVLAQAGIPIDEDEPDAGDEPGDIDGICRDCGMEEEDCDCDYDMGDLDDLDDDDLDDNLDNDED